MLTLCTSFKTEGPNFLKALKLKGFTPALLHRPFINLLRETNFSPMNRKKLQQLRLRQMLQQKLKRWKTRRLKNLPMWKHPLPLFKLIPGLTSITMPKLSPIMKL